MPWQATFALSGVVAGRTPASAPTPRPPARILVGVVPIGEQHLPYRTSPLELASMLLKLAAS
jgi:hypothetical protein